MSSWDKARWRKLWLDVHLWIGVGLALLVIPLSVTGAALVWHDGVDEMLNPERYRVTGVEAAQPASAYVAAAENALAEGAQAARVAMPEEAGAPVTVRAMRAVPGSQRPNFYTVYLDPPTARVLDVADFRGSFVGVMHMLHGSFMVPGIGRRIVGWVGVAMFVSCLTGIWLWWPRNNRFLKALKWRRVPTTMGNLHYTLGFWIAVPLAMLSFTGAYISFPQTATAVYGIFAGTPPENDGGRRGPPRRRFELPVRGTAMTVDQAADAAKAALPGAEIVTMSMAAGTPPVWQIEMIADGERRRVGVADADGVATVQRVPESGRAAAARNADGARSFAMTMRRWHDGQGMGLVWQIVIFAGGIIPAILGVTGIVMWWRRRANRKALARRLAAAE